jgi:hypothetical protein
MMKEILELIRIGGRSVRDMALELEIDRRSLEDRLNSLVSLGYIKEMKFIADCGAKRCRDCPMGSTCGGDQDLIPRVFELTEKGKRALHAEKTP